MDQGAAAAKEYIRSFVQHFSTAKGKHVRNMRVCVAESWDAEAIYAAVKDMSNEEFTTFVLDANLKGEGASEFEKVLRRPTVESKVKDLRKQAEDRQKVASTLKYLNNASFWDKHPRFPKDFKGLHAIKAVIDGKTISLLEAADDPEVFLRYTIIFSGPPKRGKTPCARALAAYWALGMDKPFNELFIIYTGTMANLNRVSALGYMQQLQPLVIDDSELDDGNQNRTGAGDNQKLRANYVKHLLNVSDGGEVGARFNQVNIEARQPRIVCINGSVKDWLPKGICNGDDHEAAIYKRIVVFEFKDSVVPEQVQEDHAQMLRGLGDSMKARRAARDAW